ncbi:MAG TPA: hypothetical protein VFA89_03535 [Terriglobales bacterium]|nr:hypothetical protein [Terriglobales bacterium]
MGKSPFEQLKGERKVAVFSRRKFYRVGNANTLRWPAAVVNATGMVQNQTPTPEVQS